MKYSIVVVLILTSTLYSAQHRSDKDKRVSIMCALFAGIEEGVKQCTSCYPLYRKTFPGMLQENNHLSQEQLQALTPSEQEAEKNLNELKTCVRNCKNQCPELLGGLFK